MGNLTRGQWLGMIVLGLGILATASPQLTILFGTKGAAIVTAAATLLSAFFGGAITLLTGQGSQVDAVRAMPGVEKILVNKDANATLATRAVSQDDNKVEATPAAKSAVEATAKAAS